VCSTLLTTVGKIVDWWTSRDFGIAPKSHLMSQLSGQYALNTFPSPNKESLKRLKSTPILPVPYWKIRSLFGHYITFPKILETFPGIGVWFYDANILLEGFTPTHYQWSSITTLYSRALLASKIWKNENNIILPELWDLPRNLILRAKYRVGSVSRRIPLVQIYSRTLLASKIRKNENIILSKL